MGKFIRHFIKINIIILFVAVLWGPAAQADQFFRPHRFDQTVPEHCRDMDINFFDGPFHDVTVGVVGARQKGFTHEIPIRRDQANVLWHVFKERARNSVNMAAERYMVQDPSLEPFYRMIEANYRQMGFTFNSEGDVLELLSLVYMQSVFPPSQYYHTGGYGYIWQSREMGELDMIIGRRTDCEVVVVGQAKLGIGSVSAAWEQIERFKSFVAHILNQVFGVRAPHY